jgi:hypothetical protein
MFRSNKREMGGGEIILGIDSACIGAYNLMDRPMVKQRDFL